MVMLLGERDQACTFLESFENVAQGICKGHLQHKQEREEEEEVEGGEEEKWSTILQCSPQDFLIGYGWGHPYWKLRMQKAHHPHTSIHGKSVPHLGQFFAWMQQDA